MPILQGELYVVIERLRKRCIPFVKDSLMLNKTLALSLYHHHIMEYSYYYFEICRTK